MSAESSVELPDYRALANAMRRSGLSHSPSEAHGLALGLLLSGADHPQDAWQRELYSEFDPNDLLAVECRTQLERLYAHVVTTHQEMQGMSLLLPEDIVVDTPRLVAVRDWCQGFLYGFGLGGERSARALSTEARELLRDFAEVTRLQTDDVENSAENQSALIEIEEYLRVGVMLIRDELRANKTDA